MLNAGNEYGNWLADPDLARLRHEWICAFHAWQRVAPKSSRGVRAEDRRTRLARYRDAETAYFDRWHTLRNRR